MAEVEERTGGRGQEKRSATSPAIPLLTAAVGIIYRDYCSCKPWTPLLFSIPERLTGCLLGVCVLHRTARSSSQSCWTRWRRPSRAPESTGWCARGAEGQGGGSRAVHPVRYRGE